MWRLLMTRIEECWELVAEVKNLDLRTRTLQDAIDQRDAEIDQRDAEIDQLHARLAGWEERRTTGGPDRGYTPNWTTRLVDSGAIPGDLPVADPPKSATEDPQLNRFRTDKEVA